MKNVSQIIIKKPYLAWYVKDVKKLFEESVLEHILNYGDWEDMQEFIKIKGKKETTTLFLTH